MAKKKYTVARSARGVEVGTLKAFDCEKGEVLTLDEGTAQALINSGLLEAT